MAKAEATVEELVNMTERGELCLATQRGILYVPRLAISAEADPWYVLVDVVETKYVVDRWPAGLQ